MLQDALTLLATMLEIAIAAVILWGAIMHQSSPATPARLVQTEVTELEDSLTEIPSCPWQIISEIVLCDELIQVCHQATDQPDEAAIAELLSIAPTSHQIDWSQTKVHQLRTLGSLLNIPGARRWNRQQALDGLVV
jgi:hypothetical protein